MLEAAAMVTRLWTDKAWTRPITTDKEAEMADKDKSGIEMLRELAKDVSHNSLYEILKEGREDKWGAERFGGSVKESLLSIAGRIERERAEELAAAKRGLTDEARVVVERLRALDGCDVFGRSGEYWKNNWEAVEKAIGADCDYIRSYQGDLDSVRDRLIELIGTAASRARTWRRCGSLPTSWTPKLAPRRSSMGARL